MRLKKRYFLRAALLILCVFIELTAAFVAKHYYSLKIENFSSKVEPTKEGEAITHSYYVTKGMTIDDVLTMLEQDYNIGSRQDFKLHARLMHFNYPEPGFYTFDANCSNEEVIDRLKYGKQTPVHITWNNSIFTREQLAGAVTTHLQMDSVTLLSYLENNEFLAQYNLNKETSRCLFIPNTYEVLWTITPEQLFARMQREFNIFWNDERRAKAEKIGLSPGRVYGDKWNNPEVCYIHGKAGDGHSINDMNLIFGIDEYLDENSSQLDNYYIRFKKFYQRIVRRPSIEYKRWIEPWTSNHPNADVDQLYLDIWGHSLSVADKDAIRELVLTHNSVTTIHYYDRNALDSIVENLVAVIGKEELIERTCCHPAKLLFIEG